MFQVKATIADQANKPVLYRELDGQLAALLHGEHDMIANAANMSALLFMSLPDINWVGFYFLKNNELVVGPFQGKPACVRIAVGHGVCGTAVAESRTILVPDVHAFPGHIACDPASNSELVVPLIRDGMTLGVLDLDSPKINRFDLDDQQGLEQLVATFVSALAA